MLLKLKLKVERRGLRVDRRGRQRIKIDKMKEYEVRREYQERLDELYNIMRCIR